MGRDTRDVEAVRDYMQTEGQSAAPLVAWELGISDWRAQNALKRLLAAGTIREHLPRELGIYGGPAVYEFVRPDNGEWTRPVRLEEAEPGGDLAPDRTAEIVRTGKARGPAPTPLALRRQQKNGKRLRHRKQTGHH